VWWALLEEVAVAPRAIERLRWLAMVRRWLVMFGATTYTKIYGQQQWGKCWCVAGSQPMQLTGTPWIG